MTCKFCLQNKPTIDAHIIPKCFFKPLLGGKPPIAVSLSHESFPKRIPIGIYDKELVCIDCEGLWNDYDDYVCKFIIQDFNKNFKKSESGEWFEAQQYDYEKLKLFFYLFYGEHQQVSPTFLKKSILVRNLILN